MHLRAGGQLHLQYFMPQHQPKETTDMQDTAVCSSSTSPAATMWEYHQAAHAAAFQTSSSSSSFPSWSPYAATTTALLGASPAFATDSSPSSDMRLPAAGEHIHGHAWSQHGEQSNSTCYRENFIDLLSSKNVTTEMFEDVPAGHYAAPALSTGRFGAGSDVSPVKYEITGSPLFLGNTNGVFQGMNTMSCTPCYAYADHHQMKEGSDQQQQELTAPAMASFLQQLSTNASVGMHASLDYSGIGGLDKICQESRAMDASPFSMRSLPDLSSFGGYRSTAESTSSVQPYMRSTNLSDSSKQEHDIVSARSSSSGSGAASDRKKRPSEERTSTVKKSKQEVSKASPPKMQQQVPKVKIGEKITALQQIVSPFGKTDTASVLFETIKYIKFLHEQVQLLSEPYTNLSRDKGNVPWGDHAEASKGEAEHDLRDRGLCLVPVSWTPEVYRDGTAMDYWTPTYRGCLYR